ncbi:hypothetical protein [Streptomyces qaidamensis]|uniref:hypothetical protein n=1 Tax=Streptomyces qaidamensis TaxID=1783515 RepID=UPI000A573BF4|nr:hypothetical protein [Streptomyces qaidamensis]
MRSTFSPSASRPTFLPHAATRRPFRIAVDGDAPRAPGHIREATGPTAGGVPECADEMAVV